MHNLSFFDELMRFFLILIGRDKEKITKSEVGLQKFDFKAGWFRRIS